MFESIKNGLKQVASLFVEVVPVEETTPETIVEEVTETAFAVAAEAVANGFVAACVKDAPAPVRMIAHAFTSLFVAKYLPVVKNTVLYPEIMKVETSMADIAAGKNADPEVTATIMAICAPETSREDAEDLGMHLLDLVYPDPADQSNIDYECKGRVDLIIEKCVAKAQEDALAKSKFWTFWKTPVVKQAWFQKFMDKVHHIRERVQGITAKFKDCNGPVCAFIITAVANVAVQLILKNRKEILACEA